MTPSDTNDTRFPSRYALLQAVQNRISPSPPSGGKSKDEVIQDLELANEENRARYMSHLSKLLRLICQTEREFARKLKRIERELFITKEKLWSERNAHSGRCSHQKSEQEEGQQQQVQNDLNKKDNEITKLKEAMEQERKYRKHEAEDLRILHDDQEQKIKSLYRKLETMQSEVTMRDEIIQQQNQQLRQHQQREREQQDFLQASYHETSSSRAVEFLTEPKRLGKFENMAKFEDLKNLMQRRLDNVKFAHSYHL